MLIKHKQATGIIKWYLRRNNFLGWTSFWNTIYYIDKESMNNESLIKHELTHIKQIEDDGIIKFSLKYTYYFIKYGYKNNPYEIEARENELKEHIYKD